MSDLFDDDLLSEDDLRKLRPPTVEVVPEIEEEDEEVLERVPAQREVVEEEWWVDPLMLVSPWLGRRQRVAMASCLRLLEDGEWHWQQELADQVAKESEMTRVSVLSLIRKVTQAGLFEKRDRDTHTVEVRWSRLTLSQ